MTVSIYLGTNEPAWLPRMTTPLFVARQRLARRKRLPRAAGRWALDSGGFMHLRQNGRWTIAPAQYAAEARRYRDEVGGLDWAAIQDWMCEDEILKKTGLSVREHQTRTIDSYAQLLDIAPEMPWCPVLQGWTPGDYLDHVEQYARRGFQLAALPIVGLGSVCRRQNTARVEMLARQLVEDAGIRLHGFGFKVQGLRRVWSVLTSSDSMAWSLNARKSPPLEGCTHKHCASCARWALAWLERLQDSVDTVKDAHERQGRLFDVSASGRSPRPVYDA